MREIDITFQIAFLHDLYDVCLNDSTKCIFHLSSLGHDTLFSFKYYLNCYSFDYTRVRNYHSITSNHAFLYQVDITGIYQ